MERDLIKLKIRLVLSLSFKICGGFTALVFWFASINKMFAYLDKAVGIMWCVVIIGCYVIVSFVTVVVSAIKRPFLKEEFPGDLK